MDALIALLTLTALEIVLGIDNIVFIAILTARVEPSRRLMVQRLGLLAAMGSRLLLLTALGLLASLTTPWITIAGHGLSGRDLILLVGGLILIAKATHEIHHRVSPDAHDESVAAAAASSIGMILTQIVLIDVVFSLDSVITAIGMARELWVMASAVVISVGVMMIAADPIARYLNEHPTLKMLALAFLLLIGVMLVAEALGAHLSKSTIYFAIGFSLFVEALNLRVRRAGERLRERILTIGQPDTHAAAPPPHASKDV